MRMFGVGIRRVVVIMVVVMVMMVMIMVVMVVVMIRRLKTTHAGTESITKRTIRDVRARRIGALPFDVVVMTFLNRAYFALEPQNGGSVFAQDTCWWRHRPKGRMAAVFGADVMVLAVFQCQNLTAIATNATVRWRRVADLFHNPLGKGLEHLGVITQIAGFDELDVCVLGSDLIGEPIDTVDQNPRKQEVWEDDDAFIRKARHML